MMRMRVPVRVRVIVAAQPLGLAPNRLHLDIPDRPLIVGLPIRLIHLSVDVRVGQDRVPPPQELQEVVPRPSRERVAEFVHIVP